MNSLVEVFRRENLTKRISKIKVLKYIEPFFPLLCFDSSFLFIYIYLITFFY